MQLKIGKLLTIILLVAFLPVTLAHADECDQGLKIRISGNYPPFSKADQEGKLSGTDVDFIRDIFSEVGCPIEFTVMPYKRAYIELSSGRIDMILATTAESSLDNAGLFSRPFRMATAGLVFRQNMPAIRTITSLEEAISRGLVIGYEPSSYHGKDFDQFLRNPKSQVQVFAVESAFEGIRMINAGRIDAYIDLPDAARAIASDLGFGGVLADHSIEVSSRPMHFLFSRRSVSSDLIMQVNEAIKRKLSDPDYQKSYGAFGLAPATLSFASATGAIAPIQNH